MTNAIHRIDDALTLRAGGMVLPDFVDFHTSNICNMDCHGCAYHGMLTGELMPEDKHFQAADIFLSVGVKAFDFAGGGDPTCLPYLPKLMQHIADNGAYPALLTNGLLLKNELIDVLVEHGNYCRISLEASNKKEYCAYKHVHPSVWDKVLDNIACLVSERNKRKSDLEITLKFSVGKSLRGADHYRRIKDLVCELGADGATVKALRHEPEELSADEKRFEAALYAASGDGFRSWITEVPMEKIPQCYLSPMHAVMDWRGDLYFCCFYYYREREHRIGNIFDGDFKKLWFGSVHQAKRKAIDRNECAKVDCKFFMHHWAVERALKRGSVYWL